MGFPQGKSKTVPTINPVIFLLVVLVLLAVHATANALLLHRLKDFSKAVLPERLPRVSVLIPARNEAENLSALLPSLIAQDYPNLEIVILNDHSEDSTQSIIEQFSAADRRIWSVKGKALPTGWVGKNWACQQLADNASGDIFVFLDADTICTSRMVGEIVSAMHNLKAQAISAWPQHLVNTRLARLAQPVQQWSLMAFLPFGLVSNNNYPMAVAAIGQLLAFRRKCYEAIGGHESVRGSIIEDMALARRIKGVGAKFALLSGVGSVASEMYKNDAEVNQGFAKNIYPAFGASPINLMLVVLVFATLYLAPWAWLIRSVLSAENVLLPLLAVGFSLYPRVLSDWRFGYPVWLAFTHPLSLFAWSAIALESWQHHMAGHVIWKGRDYDLRSAKSRALAGRQVQANQAQASQISSVPRLHSLEEPVPVPAEKHAPAKIAALTSEELDARLEREAKTLSKLDWNAEDAYATQILPPTKTSEDSSEIAEA